MRVLQQDLCCSCRSQAAEDGCVTPAASAGEGMEPASLLRAAGILQGCHQCVCEITDDASQWCQLVGAE